MNIIICDTCSIIRLYKAESIHLLGQFYDKVYIPEAVQMEFNKETRKAIELPFFEVLKVSNVLPIGMGIGEREAISLAVELNIKDIITDDDKAFKNSIRQGLYPISIFKFLIMAKYAGLTKEVKPLMDKMKEKNEGIADDLYIQTLMDAKEFIGQ